MFGDDDNQFAGGQFGYIPPGSGYPYGRIVPLVSAQPQADAGNMAQPVSYNLGSQNGSPATVINNNAATPGATAIPTPRAPIPSAMTAAGGLPSDRILWGQLGQGALRAGAGAAGVLGGYGLTDTGIGAAVGVPMMITSGSDAIQGATQAWNALQGHQSDGYNPVKSAIGAPVYDGIELGLVPAAAAAPARLIVDPSVTGINTTRSIFGATVPQWRNPLAIPGTTTVLDPAVRQGMIVGSGVSKGAQAYQDNSGGK